MSAAKAAKSAAKKGALGRGLDALISARQPALQQAMPDVPDGAQLLVQYGDVPLITTGTLKRLLAAPGRLAVLVAGWFAFRAGEGMPQDLRLFLATGILGGFTTFSAFSLDAVLLWERGEAMLAATYVIGSVVLSLAALVGGLAVMRSMS